MGKKAKGKKGKGEKGKGGCVWTDYTDIKHGKKQTMKEKSIYIAKVVLAFNWMCLTHHVNFEGSNDYHGRKQHQVREVAAAVIFRDIEETCAKKKDIKAVEAKGKLKVVKKQGEKRKRRHELGQTKMNDAVKAKGPAKRGKKVAKKKK